MEEINPLEYSNVVWDTKTNQPLVSNLSDITEIIHDPHAQPDSNALSVPPNGHLRARSSTQPSQSEELPASFKSEETSSSFLEAPLTMTSPQSPLNRPLGSPPNPSSGAYDGKNVSTLTSFNLVAQRVPYQITVTEPQKHGESMKEAYVSYLVTTLDVPSNTTYSVRRRFTDFVWLHQLLSNLYPTAIICPLPDKHRMEYITGDRFSAEFVDKRRASLQRFLNRIIRHPIVQNSPDLRQFLTSSDLNTELLRQKREGLMDNLSDAIMNTFSKLKAPDEKFVGLKDQITRLEENLQTLERIYTRVIKKHLDLEHDLADFSAGATSLGVLETDITDSMTKIGALLFEQTKILALCIHHEDVDFTSHLRDYLTYCSSIKQILKIRDHKQMDYEVLNDALTSTQLEIDKLYKGGSLHSATSTSQAIGNYIKEKYEEFKRTDQEKLRQDRILKLEAKTKELEKEVLLAKDILTKFSDEIVKEIDYFHAARSLEFKDIFSEYADGQIQYFQKSLRVWESMLPILEEVQVDD